MRLPSLKTISKEFPYLHPEDVKKVRKTLENYCHQPIKCLKKLNLLLEGCGIEYISDRRDSDVEIYGIEYVNLGDSYVATFCYDRDSGRLFISSWGDIVEKNSKRFSID